MNLNGVVVVKSEIDLLSDLGEEINLFEGEEEENWENFIGVSVGRQIMN